jgi:hypothetical protein
MTSIATVNWPQKAISLLDYVEGTTTEDKLMTLIRNDLAQRLRECEREIGDFELRYQMTFAEFAEAWERGDVASKWSHRVERDYMTWEGLEAEKRKWLSLLKVIAGEAQNA